MGSSSAPPGTTNVQKRKLMSKVTMPNQAQSCSASPAPSLVLPSPVGKNAGPILPSELARAGHVLGPSPRRALFWLSSGCEPPKAAVTLAHPTLQVPGQPAPHLSGPEPLSRAAWPSLHACPPECGSRTPVSVGWRWGWWWPGTGSLQGSLMELGPTG